jgi:hypothetical protein
MEQHYRIGRDINPLYGNDVVGCRLPDDEDQRLVSRFAAELTGAKAGYVATRRLLDRLLSTSMPAAWRAAAARDGITIDRLMLQLRQDDFAVNVARAAYKRALEITGLEGEDL